MWPLRGNVRTHPKEFFQLRARARGGTVILITNAPRPSEVVARQLERLHVPREVYDAIVSSGDVTRSVIEERRGQTLYHLGPERDRSIFSGLDVRFAPPETADYVVCSGLEDDEVETPDDYRARLESMLARKLFMVCGNPDMAEDCRQRLAARGFVPPRRGQPGTMAFEHSF